MEHHVRRLVAHHLGVAPDDLVSEVSLRDELAADSLDLVELAMALELEFTIVIPERLLGRVRTYSDLVRTTALLVAERVQTACSSSAVPVHRLAKELS